MDSKDIRNLQEAYSNVYQEVDEATKMAKLGYDEVDIRNKIAAKTSASGAGKFADKATKLADRETYGNKEMKAGRENLARKQRGTFRDTTSSSPGLRGYGFKSNDPAVKAKQDARGNQRARAALTPNERKQLNMEFDLYDVILSHLLDEGYADTQESALAIMGNMSEDWRESIVEAKKPLPIGKMKKKEMELMDKADKALGPALRTPMNSPERNAALRTSERGSNISDVRRSVSTRGGKMKFPMPEVGRFKPKDED